MLGVLFLISGLSRPDFNSMLAGRSIILCSLAYRSAKRRKYDVVSATRIRIAVELVAVMIAIALNLLRNDLKDAIAEDPVPSFIVPMWCLVAYVLVNAKKVRRQNNL